MIKFFQWLFKSSSPKTIRVEDLYYIERRLIMGKTDDKSGLIDSISLNNGAKFEKLVFTKKNVIESQNRGIAKTLQNIDVLIEDEKITDYFEQARTGNLRFSFIYKTMNGKFLLYGENNGMEVKKAIGKHLIFSGEEQDTFYTLTTDCAQQLIGK